MLNLTLEGLVFFIVVMIVAVLSIIILYIADLKQCIVAPVIVIIVAIIIAFYSSWYNSNTADGQRNIKDNKSNIEGGLDRKITIYYYGKEEPIVFEGKIDLQDKDDNKVLEFILDGKKYIYYIGILDRYIIEEK